MQCAKRFTVALLETRWKTVRGDSVKNPQWSTLCTRRIHTSCTSREFHEYDKRSGYDTGYEIADTRIERIRLGLKQLKKEIQLWKHEIKEYVECDPIQEYRAGIWSVIVIISIFFFHYTSHQYVHHALSIHNAFIRYTRWVTVA